MLKTSLSDLAIFGALPAFEEPLFVGRPNQGNRTALIRRIEDILDRNWLTNDGPFVREFEERIASHVGTRNCVAMANGTIALEIAIRAMSLRGEVILPSFTFIATAHALQWQEITPVFCDVNPETHLLDPSCIERLITPRTSAIIGVHTWGRVCDTSALAKMGERHQLPILYDAAHAFGNTSGGTSVGQFGVVEVFSFHATKFINTFEGGAVVTDDDTIADRMRLMRNFGFVGYDDVQYVGTNGKMSEISAAQGITCLESIDHFMAVNRDNYLSYISGLADIDGLKVLPYPPDEQCNCQYVVLEVSQDTYGLTRDQLLTLLWAENVQARRYFFPGCHNVEPYRSNFPNAYLLLPHTDELCARVLTLPTGTAVNSAIVGRICAVIRLGSIHSDAIACHLDR